MGDVNEHSVSTDGSTVFRFDGDAYCMIHCRPNSDVVQMTSNIADAEVGNMMADELRKRGGHVFRVVPANVLIAALELIKTLKHEKPKRTVMFEFDERSYESMEDIKRRTGCEFKMIVVRNPETGEEREIGLPVMP